MLRSPLMRIDEEMEVLESVVVEDGVVPRAITNPRNDFVTFLSSVNQVSETTLLGPTLQLTAYSTRRPEIARAITNCWISDVPSKMV